MFSQPNYQKILSQKKKKKKHLPNNKVYRPGENHQPHFSSLPCSPNQITKQYFLKKEKHLPNNKGKCVNNPFKENFYEKKQLIF